MYMRLFLFLLCILFSQSTIAEVQETTTVSWVKDWRLEKPFFHGFIGAITLNQFELFPRTWKKADKNEPNAMAPGSVWVLEKNKKIPFYIGMFSGGVFVLLILLGIYRSYIYRYAIRNFKYQKDLNDAL